MKRLIHFFKKSTHPLQNEHKLFPVITFILILVYLAVVFKTAWVSDDGYITFRTVDNFVKGYGLTWNTTERVQAYTNPLMMFIMVFFYFFTRDVYYTSLVVSFLFSLGTVFIVARMIARSESNAWLALILLTIAKGFMDYSTSGLENPLSHFFIALFFYIYLKKDVTVKNLFYLCLTGSLLMLNRLDMVLIMFPALCFYIFRLLRGQSTQSWKSIGIKTLISCVLGFIPMIAWELFSLLYYGLIFPNTYYAKIYNTMSRAELIEKGLFYLQHSFTFDPFVMISITIAFILSVIFFFINKKYRPYLFIGLGILLYILYIIKVGADFMAGRFLTGPYLAAVIVLASLISLKRPITIGLAAAVLLISLFFPLSPLRSAPLFVHIDNDQRGIADERGVYYEFAGLLHSFRESYWPKCGFGARHVGEQLADKAEKFNTMIYKLQHNIGAVGFYAGPQVHLIDKYGLSEPLLSKLHGSGRIGHIKRELPPGYYTTIITGENRLKNKDLALFYDKLALLTKGKLFSAERFGAIIKMNMGAYEHLTENPYHVDIPFTLEELSDIKQDGTPGDYRDGVIFKTQVPITLGKIYTADTMEISLENNDDYTLELYRNNTIIYSQTIPRRIIPQGNLSLRTITLPSTIAAAGYDSLIIKAPSNGDGFYCLGHVLILDEAYKKRLTAGGLTGYYYNDIEFTSLVHTRQDAAIDFDWFKGSPAPGVNIDNFAIRWEGYLIINKAGTYQFLTTSDDGVRLTVNSTVVIDNFTPHAATDDLGNLSLPAGKYPIRLDYYDSGFDAVIRLKWRHSESGDDFKTIGPESFTTISE